MNLYKSQDSKANVIKMPSKIKLAAAARSCIFIVNLTAMIHTLPYSTYLTIWLLSSLVMLAKGVWQSVCDNRQCQGFQKKFWKPLGLSETHNYAHYAWPTGTVKPWATQSYQQKSYKILQTTLWVLMPHVKGGAQRRFGFLGHNPRHATAVTEGKPVSLRSSFCRFSK